MRWKVLSQVWVCAGRVGPTGTKSPVDTGTRGRGEWGGKRGTEDLYHQFRCALQLRRHHNIQEDKTGCGGGARRVTMVTE